MNLNFCGYGSPAIWATEQMFGGAHTPPLYGAPNTADCPPPQGVRGGAHPEPWGARHEACPWHRLTRGHTHPIHLPPRGACRPLRGTLDGMRKHIAQPKWSPEDRQAFADGVRLRATTLPDRRKEASRRACRGYRPRGQGG